MENPGAGLRNGMQILPRWRAGMNPGSEAPLEVLGGFLGFFLAVFSWQQIRPPRFSLRTSFSRSGSVPSERIKKINSHLLKGS